MNGHAVAGPSGTSASSATGHSTEDSFFKPLEQGATTIKKFLQEDSQWPDLSDHLAASPHAYKLQLVEPWAPLDKRRMISIPDSITETITTPNVHTRQGLFPEIQRAWIVIDNVLHLWNYLEGSSSSIETYEHPDSFIEDVALVQPRAGVFIENIKNVLVIAARQSLSLLCLAWDQPQPRAQPGGGQPAAPELALYVPDMKVDTGGTLMSDICGTSAGRIFCRGNDECVYELIYQAREGWFSKKCYLRNLTSPWQNVVPTALSGGKRGESFH